MGKKQKSMSAIEKAMQVRLVANHLGLHSAEEIAAALTLADEVISELLHRRYLATTALDLNYEPAATGEIVRPEQIAE